MNEANLRIAERLREAATLLREQNANPFRAAAYVRAGDAVAAFPEDVSLVVRQGGADALRSIPGVGPGIAAAISEMLRTGRWALLDRLRGEHDPERLFQLVPGVGPELARRIHERLHIDTLEALEAAAHDGSLMQVAGVGGRRAAMIRGALAGMLGRSSGARPKPAEEPPVELLLEIDREYRAKASADALPRIAPRRFNPTGEAWLPILHAESGDWRFTALFSNTARAHELGKTHDWVVIYFQRAEGPEGQRTVVTEGRGPFAGRRVVRGREAECDRFQAARPSLDQAAAASAAGGGPT